MVNGTSGRLGALYRVILPVTIVIAALVGLLGRARCQEAAPLAPDVFPDGAALHVAWDRFDRLADVARGVEPAPRLSDVARGLQSALPPEAGRLSPLDWYCLGTAWCALHPLNAKGKAIYRDTSGMVGEEVYALSRQGYRLNDEQATRVHARLLSLLGVPSQVMTGLVRGSEINRGAWSLCQVGATWLRADVVRCAPRADSAAWRPAAAWFQAAGDLDGVLAFLASHLPDGDAGARQQGLNNPATPAEWENWAKAEARIRRAAQAGRAELFASRAGMVTPDPLRGNAIYQEVAPPPTPAALSMLEQLRRKGARPTRGEYLVATAMKYVGLPYIWGGEDPNRGFDCSGLIHYVCRTWGISLPRTAAEQYHVGRPVAFLDLEPGDLVFLANTYKPGVSHVGMYIGNGQWIQAAGTGIGIVVGDVPYFDAGNGPGARRLNLSRLPRVADEPAAPAPVRSELASRHGTPHRPTEKPAPIGKGSVIVQVRICGDTGGIANSGCDTYKVIRIPKAQAKSLRRCTRHHPLGGERW